MAIDGRDVPVQELLELLSSSFRLDELIGGVPLGELLAATVRDACAKPLPDFGSAGDRRLLERTGDGPLTFLYRPHLFPDMDGALRLGHQVQYHLLPRALPPSSPVAVAAVLESYCHLSGDLFGWQAGADGRLALWLLDVSGHGVRAGFAAVVLKLLLAEIDPELPLELTASRLEERFLAIRNPDDPGILYATGVLLRIAGDGAVDYLSAGHQPVLVWRADGEVDELEPTGMPLALIPGNPWRQESLRLAPGDVAVIYSDGLIDLVDSSEERFGERRLAAVLGGGGRPVEVADRMICEIEAFHDLERLADDLSFIVLRRADDG